ncbi:MAG: ArsR family transcriptional regulator [Nanoarchaeota archaeon]
MEYEPLLTGTRWQILELLSEKRQSPLEISIRIKTTLANVSQQLRLLEVAGLVKTEKLRQRDKGKPRILYSIADDFGYIVLAAPGSARKSLLSLTFHQKLTLSLWHVAPSDLHGPAGAFLTKFDEYSQRIDAIYFSKKFDELCIVTDAKELKKLDGQSITSKCISKILDLKDIRQKTDSIILLHKRTEVLQV